MRCESKACSEPSKAPPHRQSPLGFQVPPGAVQYGIQKLSLNGRSWKLNASLRAWFPVLVLLLSPAFPFILTLYRFSLCKHLFIIKIFFFSSSHHFFPIIVLLSPPSHHTSLCFHLMCKSFYCAFEVSRQVQGWGPLWYYWRGEREVGSAGN